MFTKQVHLYCFKTREISVMTRKFFETLLVFKTQSTLFSRFRHMPKLPLIALNFPRKESKHLLLLKCLKQKITAKPLKLLIQLMVRSTKRGLRSLTRTLSLTTLKRTLKRTLLLSTRKRILSLSALKMALSLTTLKRTLSLSTLSLRTLKGPNQTLTPPCRL